MVEKILNNTTPYGKIRASHEGSLHSSTLNRLGSVPFLLSLHRCPLSSLFTVLDKGRVVDLSVIMRAL